MAIENRAGPASHHPTALPQRLPSAAAPWRTAPLHHHDRRYAPVGVKRAAGQRPHRLEGRHRNYELRTEVRTAPAGDDLAGSGAHKHRMAVVGHNTRRGADRSVCTADDTSTANRGATKTKSIVCVRGPPLPALRANANLIYPRLVRAPDHVPADRIR